MITSGVLLPVIVGLLMLQALVTFTVFFTVPYRTRRRMLDAQYGTKNSATNRSDVLLLAITLIQTCFHDFSEPIAPQKLPRKATSSPIKMMSYAIQAAPGRA